jgi:hypothetical protein
VQNGSRQRVFAGTHFERFSMSALNQPRFISEEEYRDGEEFSPIKHEWFRGEVFAMAGGTYNHARLCSRITAMADARLRGSRCTALGGEMRVKVAATGLHTYPTR